MSDLERAERLQIMLSMDELAALEDWRFKERMPSRAAAVRELLRRGLIAEGFSLDGSRRKSSDYGMLSTTPSTIDKTESDLGGDSAET